MHRADAVLEVRLLACTLEELAHLTELPPEEAGLRAFRRGLAVLSGSELLPATGADLLDDLVTNLVEADASVTLNGWRVFDRLRRYEALDPSVEALADENASLRARLLHGRQVETFDQAAALRRLFGPRGPSG